MRIYNTKSRQVEEFTPINPPSVTMYSCGPTVYDYQHIGHMRRYVGDDILINTLRINDFDVKHAMNITDVGHLTSDADSGEDKMEKGAKKFGKSVWDLAKFFEDQFKDSCKELGIKLPENLMHATDYIKQQIDLIKILEEKGFTYKTDDGIYYDTSKFSHYFDLSRQNPDKLMAGARVGIGEKKNITDFALWKFSPKDEKRQMEWESPWGMGFPGWHIECSAMAMSSLGESIDVHTGGIDHIDIHHTNEIAQSEAATDKPFVKYWVHHNFLIVEGQKMSKSLGNFYTVQDVVEKGYDPLALRYLYLQTHYRQEMNFTWESLDASQTALNKLRAEYAKLDVGEVDEKALAEFKDALNDDLNTPKSLAVLWESIKSGSSKSTLQAMDNLLGVGIDKENKQKDYPEEVKKLLEERERLRSDKKYAEADQIRDKIISMGFEVHDK